jgi:predicted permease
MLTDLRFAVRLLLKNPGFTAIAVLALGLGIGLSTAIFNAYSAIVLRPIPHLVDEDRIAFVNPYNLKLANIDLGMSLPDFVDLREQSTKFEGWTVVQNRTMVFGGEKPERLLGAGISAAGFHMMGVVPLRGRLFRADEEKPGAAPVALLGYSIWQTRFGGRDNVIGQRVIINGAPTEIVGVMPEGFRFPELADMWMPFVIDLKGIPRNAFNFPAYARLKPGVSVDEGAAELATLGANFARQYPDSHREIGFRLRALRDQTSQGAAGHVKLLLGAVAFVLLIACANVANLLLAKAATRTHEIAIRASLGASRGRIVRQVLTESLLLGSLGGALGLLIGVWSNDLMLRAIPIELPFWMKFEFDWRVFAFAAGAAIGSAVLFGLFPAFQVSRSTANQLKDGGRAGTGSRRAQRTRHSLVVTQVAMALLLLIGAGLMVRSYLKMQSADFGFDHRGLLTFRLGLPQAQFPDREVVRRFFDRLETQLTEVPGIEAATITSSLPQTGRESRRFAIEGRPIPKSRAEAPFTFYHTVSPGYPATMRVPLLQGRFFTASDQPGSPKVVVADRDFVEKWFPGADPIGKRVNFGTFEKADDWATIVGVIGTVPQVLQDPTQPKSNLYSPTTQSEFNFISVAVRTKGDPTTYTSAVQSAVISLLPGIPIYNVLTMERAIADATWDKKFFGQLFSTFGLCALFLASIGIYGVMAFTVTQRTQEIGIRMALGAQPGDVLNLIGRQGFRLVAIGMVLGLAAAFGLTRFMANFLFGVAPSDPVTYVGLTLVLGLVGLLACWLPARRATRVDPIVALRSE